MESNTEATSEFPPEPDPSMTDGAAEPTSAKPSEGAETDTQSASSEGQPDHQMPDASSLVAMAAMHLGTMELIQVMVSVFDAHAWRAMGLVADHSGEVRKDMLSAQTSIDCLAFLLGKIEPTLEEGEKRDVQRRLMDLRMNYVAKLREG